MDGGWKVQWVCGVNFHGFTEVFTNPVLGDYPKWHFADDFPFPKVGYVNSLEGIFSSSCHISDILKPLSHLRGSRFSVFS